MYGFDTINYSLRPNKVIQRQIAFDGLQYCSQLLPFSDALYIGFGSVWFSDFVLAHKRLGVENMVSIERDPVLFRRAKFNSPFRCIRVVEGDSTTVLRRLAKSRTARRRPWVLWLDYVSAPNIEVRDDIDLVLDRAPPNSVIIVTLNVVGRSIGPGLEARREALRAVFGNVIADDQALVDFQERNLPRTVGKAFHDYADSRCKDLIRSGGYIPAFLVPYRDNAQMLTVGGILPGEQSADLLRAATASPSWPGFPTIPVETPPLTPKEVAALQRLLPTEAVLSMDDVRRLGFELEDGMLEVYRAHYRRYPSFFQVVA